MKSLLLFLLVAVFVPIVPGLNAADSPGTVILNQAAAAVTAKNFDEGLVLYEQVFASSNRVDDWFMAQKGIATVEAKKGAFPVALQAARLCLDGAPNLQRFDEATQLVASIFSAMDKDVKRANDFLEFQKTGVGPNPIDQIPYPAVPFRERQFATIRSEAGDTSAGSRLRAFTFLYSGKPREAAGQFADAFRRASASPDLLTAGVDLVTVALRSLRGNAAAIDTEVEYLVSGPAGPDGETGTPDDLKDPFTGFPAPPPVGQGGLAGLPPDQLEALRKVDAAARLYASDSRMRPDLRRDALNALQHAADALDNWGAAGQREWYYEMALSPDSAGVEDLLLVGAQTAARARSLNLGGAVALWKQFPADCTAKGIEQTKGMDRAQKQFDTICNSLRKIKSRNPGMKPLSNPAVF